VSTLRNLSGPELQKVSEALQDAFTYLKLTQILKYRLDRQLANYSPVMGADMQDVTFELVVNANRRGWILNLIEAARESNPGNGKLALVYQQLGLSSVTKPAAEKLERSIRKKNQFFDPEKWRSKLAQLECQVCCIEVGNIRGTGFLVAPDAVMTNYHVIADLLKAKPARSSEEVNIVFDYKAIGDIEVNPGTRVKMATDWHIDSTPYSEFDEKTDPKGGDPSEEELDYALLRLNRAVGQEAVGEKSVPADESRGWIELTGPNYDYPENDPLFILQHPEGYPLKLAFDTESIIGLNGNGTRLRYKTNTEPGSSGSPCFNQGWELVALHHAGDPNFDFRYNQGIPIGKILNLLVKRGIAL
jgi:hypothetical protein